MFYSPLLLLVFFAFLAVVFGIVSSPYAQAIVHTLFVATLGGSLLHLQVLADARVLWTCVVPSLLLACSILFSFVSRLQIAVSALSLPFIILTLVTTVYLLCNRLQSCNASTTRTTSVPTSYPTQWYWTKLSTFPPRSATLSPSPPSQVYLVLLLLAQVTYTFATAFRVSAAFLARDTIFSSLLVSLMMLEPLTPTFLLRLLDACFLTISLALVFGAYYQQHRDYVRDPSSPACTGHIQALDILTRPKTPPSIQSHSFLFTPLSSQSTVSFTPTSNSRPKCQPTSPCDASSSTLSQLVRTPLHEQSQRSLSPTPETDFEFDLGHDRDVEIGEDSLAGDDCPSPTSTASCLPSQSSIYSQIDTDVQPRPLTQDLSHTRTRIRTSSTPGRGFKSSRAWMCTPLPALLSFGTEGKDSVNYSAQKKKKERGRASSWSAASLPNPPPSSYTYLNSDALPAYSSTASSRHSVQTEPGDCTDLRDPFAPPLTPPVVTRTWGCSPISSDSPLGPPSPSSSSMKGKATESGRKRRRRSRTMPRRVSGVRSDAEGSMEVVMEDVGKETAEEEESGMEDAVLARRLLDALVISSPLTPSNASGTRA